MFRAATAGRSGASSTVTSNAHNQTLEIAIQLGLIGVSLLYAVWIAHILMFWKGGLAASLGLGVVLQGVIGSLFLSYLTDFSTGWLYVLGVGVLGGMVADERDKAAPASECRVRRRRRPQCTTGTPKSRGFTDCPGTAMWLPPSAGAAGWGVDASVADLYAA